MKRDTPTLFDLYEMCSANATVMECKGISPRAPRRFDLCQLMYVVFFLKPEKCRRA